MRSSRWPSRSRGCSGAGCGSSADSTDVASAAADPGGAAVAGLAPGVPVDPHRVPGVATPAGTWPLTHMTSSARACLQGCERLGHVHRHARWAWSTTVSYGSRPDPRHRPHAAASSAPSRDPARRRGNGVGCREPRRRRPRATTCSIDHAIPPTLATGCDSEPLGPLLRWRRDPDTTRPRRLKRLLKWEVAAVRDATATTRRPIASRRVLPAERAQISEEPGWTRRRQRPHSTSRTLQQRHGPPARPRRH